MKKSDRKKSEEFFHAGPENFNCAQAVLKGFQEKFGVSEQLIEEFRAHGGGRAADGICGALFAAEHLLPAAKPDLEKEFEAAMGSVYCRELKAAAKSCPACVKTADRLIEKRIC